VKNLRHPFLEKLRRFFVAMANYVGNFFTHQMRRVPRTVDQFPSKIKFKTRMTRHKFAHKLPVAGKLTVMPLVDELEKIRNPHGFPKFFKNEIEGQPFMAPVRRLLAIGDEITELIRYERIEGTLLDMQDTRLYAELLLQLAVANGDRHRATMELVDFYVHDKDLIPKLFKVLVPRYVGRGASNVDLSAPSPTSLSLPTRFTDMYNLPPENLRIARRENNHLLRMRAILELRGNPWPAVVPRRRDHSGLITNVLLRAAKRSKEEAERKRAVASVKAKVAATKESMEAPDAMAAAMAAVGVGQNRGLDMDSPYARYEREKDSNLPDLDVEDDKEEVDDEAELDVKLRNLDLNLR